MSPHVALLVNPASGRGHAAVAGRRLVRFLRERGARVTVHIGRSAADSARLAREAALTGPAALVAVGGDGLVHQALQGVVGTGVPLGIIPSGTGNDIARELGAARTASPAAAEAVLAGRTRAVDAVRLSRPGAPDVHYLSVLACGFDARVNERVNGFSFSVGRAGYLLGLAAELRSFTPLGFTVDVDGRRVGGPGMLVAVGNTACYGGGMRICPGAVADDGLLEVVFVREVPLGRFLRVFPRVFAGTHTELEQVVVERGRRVRIGVDTPEGAVAYADGERLGRTPMVCEAVPGAVEVLELG